MSVATDTLRTLFNDLATSEDLQAEYKTQVALALDTLMDVETEVYNAEASKNIAINELNEYKDENKRLREYNSQLTMKLGTAVALTPTEPTEPQEPIEDNILDDIIENYTIK